ncbi:serine peptidase [Cadophora sp. DSE1049]|nr:serine peptidase [Cadophora sp. DSE1049]
MEPERSDPQETAFKVTTRDDSPPPSPRGDVSPARQDKTAPGDSHVEGPPQGFGDASAQAPDGNALSLITINGNTLDPEKDGPALRTLGLDAEDATASNFILIQTNAPLSAEEGEQLEGKEVHVHEYVSQNTYLCGYERTDLGQIRDLEFVKWVNIYLPLFVLPPSLKSGTTFTARGVISLATPPMSNVTHKVEVILHQGVDANAPEVRSKLAAVAHVDEEELVAADDKFRLRVKEMYLDAVAKIDEVYLVEKAPERKLHNTRARIILKANNITLNETTYNGEGQIVGVADTGLDTGNVGALHQAFGSRVNKIYALGGRPKGNDPDGHGTHVAGSVVSDGISTAMGDRPGFRIRGTAPAAHLVFQSVLDASGGLGGIPVNLNHLFQTAYGDNARVHNNSWGTRIPGLAYDKASREIDEFVRNNKDMVICFAAGNDGVDSGGDGIIDLNQVGSEAAAKNCISVGASENRRPEIAITYAEFGFPSAPFNKDRYSNDPDGMAAFSSRGPTRERRIKPDICAPGCGILSTRSSIANDEEFYGASTDPEYMFMAGTSQASPLVAGCCAVLREILIKTRGITSPPASLIKALLINGASDLPGQYSPSEAGASPNFHSGWGLLNLTNSVSMVAASLVQFGTNSIARRGELKKFTIPMPQGTGGTSLKISLVWTDTPGPKLHNDLDLIVRVGGQERHGNMGVGSGFDRVNNVEQVRWEGMPGTGDVEVEVKAFSIMRGPQEYSYAWSF